MTRTSSGPTQPAHSPGDSELTATLSAALKCAPALSGADIFATVRDRTATIYGQIESRQQGEIAAALALAIAGIEGVADHLLLAGPHRRTDTHIARLAVARLRRVPEVPATVGVVVHDHAMTLIGEVDRESQRGAACRAVQDVEGAMTVRNAMTLRDRPILADQDAPQAAARAHVGATR